MTNRKIDGCYVMSLPRMGRLESFYANFPTDWPFPKPEFFQGIDAQRVPLPGYWNDIPAMYGCNESHKGIMALALSRGQEQVVIFEDDARIVPGAAESILRAMEDVPDDWHGLMLGGQISVFDGHTTPVTDRISRCVQVERNHAYMLSLRGLREFYRVLCEPNSIPIDHRWGDMQEAGLVNVYRMEPFVAYQAEGESSISGVVEAARIWDERIDVRLRKPEQVEVINLICPFPVLEMLRNTGVATNGGASPPQFAMIEAGRVERGELLIADLMLETFRTDPDTARNFIEQMRNDTAFHRTAALALWHPSEAMPTEALGLPFPVRTVRATTYQEAVDKIGIEGHPFTPTEHLPQGSRVTLASELTAFIRANNSM